MSTVADSTQRILMTQREAAAALGVSERTLWDLSAPRGPIPTIRIGRAVRYSIAALKKWVEQQETVEIA